MPQEWFAVRTKSNRENIVAEALEGKGYEVLCPRYRASGLRRPEATAARQPVLRPLFPGYLFSRFDVLTRLPVLTIPGVLNVVSNGKIPIPLDSAEIESLQVLVNSDLPIGPHPYLAVGDKVIISNGPLAGAQGWIMQTDCKRLIVSITLLQRSVAVAVAGEWLEKVPGKPDCAQRSPIGDVSSRSGPYDSRLQTVSR
jgi:transcription antitermination factor NusG